MKKHNINFYLPIDYYFDNQNSNDYPRRDRRQYTNFDFIGSILVDNFNRVNSQH